MSTHQLIPSKPTAATLRSFIPLRGGLLQRKCACGGTPGPTGECEQCRKTRLQRKAQDLETSAQPSTFDSRSSKVPPIVLEVLRTPGQPLDATTRAFMEPRFGRDFSHVPVRTSELQLSSSSLTVGPADDHYEQEADQLAARVMRFSRSGAMSDAAQPFDFGHVRVHTGPEASASAAAINAVAYTVGHDIVFGAGHYAPHTLAGQRVLAHELTHVIQQSASDASGRIQRLTAAEKKEDLKSKRLKNDARLQRAFDNSPAMRKNEKGEGVKTLQRALRDLGYPMPISFDKGDADGIFEDETFATVQQFQIDHSIDHDGVVGRETLRVLDEMFSTSLTLKSIRFTSDHGLMKDNRISWDDSGPPFAKPEWTSTTLGGKSAPISHSKNKAVTVDIAVDVTPATVTGVPVNLKGRSALNFLTFDVSGSLSGGQDRTLSATSSGIVPDLIDDQHQKQTIDWSADVIGENQPLGQSLDHDVFVTYDTPVGGGVTYKRMVKAAELTKGFGNNPHDIVSGEMRRFPSYNLHKPYRGNIWPLADNIAASAECQAIVRFVQAVNNMVGVPGSARGIAVYANPNAPNVPVIALLVESGGATGAMSDFPTEPGTGNLAALFDGGDNANNYEAALEFEFGNKLFYPGGVPGGVGLTTTLAVLHSFKKMSWAKWDPVANKFVPVKLIFCYHPPC
jgi:hypothetical protein